MSTTSAHQSAKVSSPWSSDSHRAENSKGIDLGFSSLSIGGGTAGSAGGTSRPPNALSVSSLSTFATDDHPPPGHGHSRIVSDGTGNLGGTPPSPSSPLRTSRHSHGSAIAGVLSGSFSSDPGGHFLGSGGQQHQGQGQGQGQRGAGGSSQCHPSPIGTRSVVDMGGSSGSGSGSGSGSTGGGGNNNIVTSPASLMHDVSPASTVDRSMHSGGGSDSIFGGHGHGGVHSFLSKGKLPPAPPTLEPGVDRDYSRGGLHGMMAQDFRSGQGGGGGGQDPSGAPFTIPPRMDRNNDRGSGGSLGGPPGVGAPGASPLAAAFSSSPTDRGGPGPIRGSLSRIVSDSPRTAAVDAPGAAAGGKLRVGRPPLSMSSQGPPPGMGPPGMGPPRGPIPALHADDASGGGGGRERLPQHQHQHELPMSSDHYQSQAPPGHISGRGRAVTTGSASFDDMQRSGPGPARQYQVQQQQQTHDGYGRSPMDDAHHMGERGLGGGAGSYPQQHPQQHLRPQAQALPHHQLQMQQQQQRFHDPYGASQMSSSPPGGFHGGGGGHEADAVPNGYSGGHHHLQHHQQQQGRSPGGRSPTEGEMFDRHHQQQVMPRPASAGSNLRRANANEGRMNRAESVPSHLMAGATLDSSGHHQAHHHQAHHQQRQGGGDYGGGQPQPPHYQDHAIAHRVSSHEESYGVHHHGEQHRQGGHQLSPHQGYLPHHGSFHGGSHGREPPGMQLSPHHGGPGHHQHQHPGDAATGYGSGGSGGSPVFLDEMGRLSMGGGLGPAGPGVGMGHGQHRHVHQGHHQAHHQVHVNHQGQQRHPQDHGHGQGQGQGHDHVDNYDINGMRLPPPQSRGLMPRQQIQVVAGGTGHPHIFRRHPSDNDLDGLAGEHIEDPDTMGSPHIVSPVDHPHLETAAGERITSVYAHLPPPQSSSASCALTHSSSSSGGSGPRVVYSVKFKRTQRGFIIDPHKATNSPLDADIRVGAYVKVEADRGEDLGIVVGRMSAERYDAVGRFRPPPPASETGGGAGGGKGAESPPSPGGAQSVGAGVANTCSADLKRILRLATHEEVSLLAVKRDEEEELLGVCRAKVRQRGLPMTVRDAEYQFDRHKLTFFFEAEGRIDFRELVRDLFSIYKTRIWMQQLDKGCSSSTVASAGVSSSGMASPIAEGSGGGSEAGTVESEGSSKGREDEATAEASKADRAFGEEDGDAEESKSELSSHNE